MAPAFLHARGLGASADDGKRTLHAMKRSFTFIFSIESTPSPASGLGGVSGGEVGKILEF